MRNDAGPTGQPARYVEGTSAAVTVATVPVNGAGAAVGGGVVCAGGGAGVVDVVVEVGATVVDAASVDVVVAADVVVAWGRVVVFALGFVVCDDDDPLHAARANAMATAVETPRRGGRSTAPTLPSRCVPTRRRSPPCWRW
jgi:hypothetical protein